MDTIKTRLVTQTSMKTLQGLPYNGIIDCGARIAREEGIKTFYRGLAPRLLSVVPMIGIQFGVYEAMKKVMIQRSVVNDKYLSWKKMRAGKWMRPTYPCVGQWYPSEKLQLRQRLARIHHSPSLIFFTVANASKRMCNQSLDFVTRVRKEFLPQKLTFQWCVAKEIAQIP